MTQQTPSFGQALGQTARQVGKIHLRALAEYDTDFPSWMLLALLREQTGPMPAGEVIAEMDRRADVPEDQVRALLARTAERGLVSYSPDHSHPAVSLTEQGSEFFSRLYAHSRQATDAAFEGIDQAWLGTAVTVLTGVQERATSLLHAEGDAG